MIAAGAATMRHPNGDYALWQRRFWEHTLRNEKRGRSRAAHRLHPLQPVKHGLVSRVRDRPDSSFHLYVREGLLPDDWAGDVMEAGMNCGERVGKLAVMRK